MPDQKPATTQSNRGEQNLSTEEMIQKIYENSEKTRKYILFGRIISLIYLLLIVVPFIFAIFYLPPLLKNVVTPYQELLDTKGQAQNSLNGVDLNSLLKNLK